MEERYFEIKVGLFVVIGIVIFFVIVFSIGDINLVKQGYRVKTSFNFIDGVSTSAPVRYAGVTVGFVEKIDVTRDEQGATKVVVTNFIGDPGRTIEKDATASINTLGLLGEKYIEIFPGTAAGGMVTDGETIIGKDPIMMRDITDTINNLAQSANVIMSRLKDGKGTIGKLLTEEKIYDDLEAFVADIKAHPWKLLNRPRGES